MALGITGPMEPAEFRSVVIDDYFSVDWDGQRHTLQQKIDADKNLSVTNKDALIDDYCKLGSYLSKKQSVLAGLIPLEKAIRAKLEENGRAQLKQRITMFKQGDYAKSDSWEQSDYSRVKGSNEPIYFKTHKLLSSVLAEEEQRNGFNGFDPTHALQQQTLHSKATVGVKGDDGHVKKTQPAGLEMTPGGRTAQSKVKLPTGVASITSGASGMDFNRILLRHGYHWKDVGAGAVDHGEYTHRIQWYAITTNAGLGLTNTPLEIFRTMGALWARSTYPAPLEHTPDRKTYLWEIIFDCFASEDAATGQRSIAWAVRDCYNCPDHLNKELWFKPNDHPYSDADPSNLFCLRVLMNARYFKRVKVGQANIDPLARLMVDRKRVTEAYRQEGADAYLVWYLTETV